MKRLLVLLMITVTAVFATSAIALAENGPRWPTINVVGVKG